LRTVYHKTQERQGTGTSSPLNGKKKRKSMKPNLEIAKRSLLNYSKQSLKLQKCSLLNCLKQNCKNAAYKIV